MVSSAIHVTKCGGGARSVAMLANVRDCDRWSSGSSSSSSGSSSPGDRRGPCCNNRGEGQAVGASARCKAVADPVSQLRYTNFVIL
jgi:hypothetical protein